MRLFLSNEEYDSYVYRILPFNRFIESIKKQEFIFVSVNKWQDPLENFIFKQDYRMKNGEIFSFDSIRNHIYAQCWTLNEESDFSWKVYSHDFSGIKLKSQIKNLYERLGSLVTEANNRLRVGKVMYWPLEKIKEIYEKDFTKYEFQARELTFTWSLFIKREIYKHENEVRFIYVSEDNDDFSDFYKFKIDYNEIIESVSIDPRTSTEEFERKASIIKNLGFKGDIIKSDIYDNSELNIGLDSIFIN